VFVAAHGLLEAAWPGRFVYFYQGFVLVDLEEGTGVVGFGQHETGVADAVVLGIWWFAHGAEF
jgi:hypothetical protein